MEKMYLIYKITFPNNKVYIGQTCRDLNVRISQHYYESNKNPIFPVHKAISKYGKNSIKIDILEKNLNSDEAEYLEKYYIRYFNSFSDKNGYNISFGGFGFHKKHTQGTKDKISKLFKKMKINGTKYLKDFYSKNPEARSLIQLELMKDPNNLSKARISMKNARIKALKNNKIVGKAKKPIILVKNECILEFNSLTEAAKELDICVSGLSNCLNGLSKTCSGYVVYTY